MSMEMEGGIPPKKETSERSRTLEDVFKKYHEKLINWCAYKMFKRGILSYNSRSDAEDVVMSLYERLLADKDKYAIDLDRSELEIQKFLNVRLDYAIINFFRKTKKGNPARSLVSLEQVIDQKGEKDLSAQLKKYFTQYQSEYTSEEKEKIYQDIELAISRLESKNPKLADIIRKKYQLGKTLKEIGDDYGDTKQNIEQLEKKAIKVIKGIVDGRIKSDISIPQKRSHRKFNNQ